MSSAVRAPALNSNVVVWPAPPLPPANGPPPPVALDPIGPTVWIGADLTQPACGAAQPRIVGPRCRPRLARTVPSSAKPATSALAQSGIAPSPPPLSDPKLG